MSFAWFADFSTNINDSGRQIFTATIYAGYISIIGNNYTVFDGNTSKLSNFLFWINNVAVRDTKSLHHATQIIRQTSAAMKTSA